MTQSLTLAKNFLHKQVTVTIDRPYGSRHPTWDFEYEVNYGYVKGIKAPDGHDLDAYVLGVDEPLHTYEGFCIAIVHRIEDDDDKLVVTAEGVHITDSEIEESVAFQEKWFEHSIIRE